MQPAHKPLDQMRHGRKEPYTDIGVRRLPCVRCEQPARLQWNACADDNLWRPLCLDCDVALNRLVLRWMNDHEADAKADKYESEKRSEA